MKKSFLLVALLLVTVGLVSCVDSRDKTIEEIEFLLDDNNFTEAIAKAEELLEIDSEDEEAKYLLATSLIGIISSGEGNGCDDNQVGVLGLLACVLESQNEGETAFETFGRIAPVASLIDELQRATSLFSEVINDEDSDAELIQKAYLGRFLAKVYEIGGVISQIGANGENDECNACNGDPGVCVGTMKDQVPDDFASDSLEAEDETRFTNNLNTIDDDGNEAGLPTDFGIFDRTAEVLSDISDAGGDLSVFFEATFGGPKRVCDQAL